MNKKDRDAIREAILATKDFSEGAIGKWSFDENGDISAQIFTISKIEGGNFVPVKELDMAKEKKGP